MNGKRKRFAAFAAAAAAIALLLVALALTGLPRRDVVADALGPIAATSGGPGATAADPPASSAADSLPVPAPLDDQRVVAAMAPLAKLSCNRDDPVEADQDDAPPDGLDAPLPAVAADAEATAREPLVVAALAPPVAALPAPPSERPAQAAANAPADCPPLLRQSFRRLQTGEPQSLCQFRGKVLLIVNTASYCGYTNQYEGLEALYRRYKGRGLVVAGFPSNDFGGQEPGTNQEIAKFCRLTYGVQFPMFEKSSVTRLDSNPLFATLAAATGVAPKWNFYKYVVDRGGNAVAAFESDTTPNDRKLVQLIERLLAERAPEG